MPEVRVWPVQNRFSLGNGCFWKEYVPAEGMATGCVVNYSLNCLIFMVYKKPVGTLDDFLDSD